ncbi:hypothetical protein ACJX0J_033045, partial [Zea mays]
LKENEEASFLGFVPAIAVTLLDLISLRSIEHLMEQSFATFVLGLDTFTHPREGPFRLYIGFGLQFIGLSRGW